MNDGKDNMTVCVAGNNELGAPEWARTGILHDDGTTYLPGSALYGSEESAYLAAAWDGSSKSIKYKGRFYYDTDFLLRDCALEGEKMRFINSAVSAMSRNSDSCEDVAK